MKKRRRTKKSGRRTRRPEKRKRKPTKSSRKSRSKRRKSYETESFARKNKKRKTERRKKENKPLPPHSQQVNNKQPQAKPISQKERDRDRDRDKDRDKDKEKQTTPQKLKKETPVTTQEFTNSNNTPHNQLNQAASFSNVSIGDVSLKFNEPNGTAEDMGFTVEVGPTSAIVETLEQQVANAQREVKEWEDKLQEVKMRNGVYYF